MMGYSTFCFMIDLVNALKLIQPIKDKFSSVTYADLFQLARAIAIEVI
jgi:L-ascorbate peroxidase